MTYTIPSYTVQPGSVYQPPGGVPGYIKQNARGLYAAGLGAAFDSTKLLDQSPLHLGTRRTGQQGRCYLYDGTDDYSVLDSAITLSGDFSICWNQNATSFASAFHVFSKNYLDRIYFNNGGNFNFIANSLSNMITVSPPLVAGTNYKLCLVRLSDTLTLYVNGVAQADAEVNSNDFEMTFFAVGSGAYLNAEIFDVRIYSKALSASEVQFVATFGESGADPATPDHWWKCDEQSGVLGYDCIGGNNLTHINITAANFHATQDVWSFQNQVGYNLSGAVFTPRDESDPTNDVLGNPLTYTGPRPNDAALINSSCLTADGTLYIAAAHLTGAETVVRSGGTSTPSISAGRIDFAAGTCWDLLLSDGTYYPLADCWGTAISNAAVDGDDGVLTNATLASAFGATQDDFHYNILNGFSLYEHASTAAIRVPFINGSSRSFTPPTGYTLTGHYPVGSFRTPAETEINFNPDSTPEMGGQLGSYTALAAHAFGEDIDPGATDQGFARQTASKEDRFAIFAEPQTGGNLTTIERWTT